MVSDISKRTVVALVTLTLVVSILGTWTVLDNFGEVTPSMLTRDDGQSGVVFLNILEGTSQTVETPGDVAAGSTTQITILKH